MDVCRRETATVNNWTLTEDDDEGCDDNGGRHFLQLESGDHVANIKSPQVQDSVGPQIQMSPQRFYNIVPFPVFQLCLSWQCFAFEVFFLVAPL